MTSVLSSVTECITTLSDAVFSVVSAAFGNANFMALIGLGIAFSVLAWGISLIPRYR